MQLNNIELINELENISLKQRKYRNPNVVHTSLKFYGIYMDTLRKIAKKYINYDLSNLKLNEIYEVNFIYIYINLFKNRNDIDKQIDFIIHNKDLFESWSLVDNMVPLLIGADINNIKIFLKYNDEFINRFTYVILVKKITNDLMINEAFKVIINDSRYYVLMSEAWLISECFVKDFNYTLSLLKNADFLVNLKLKSVQKALESLRISDENKKILREYKNKLKGENYVK